LLDAFSGLWLFLTLPNPGLFSEQKRGIKGETVTDNGGGAGRLPDV